MRLKIVATAFLAATAGLIACYFLDHRIESQDRLVGVWINNMGDVRIHVNGDGSAKINVYSSEDKLQDVFQFVWREANDSIYIVSMPEDSQISAESKIPYIVRFVSEDHTIWQHHDSGEIFTRQIGALPVGASR